MPYNAITLGSQHVANRHCATTSCLADMFNFNAIPYDQRAAGAGQAKDFDNLNTALSPMVWISHKQYLREESCVSAEVAEFYSRNSSVGSSRVDPSDASSP